MSGGDEEVDLKQGGGEDEVWYSSIPKPDDGPVEVFWSFFLAEIFSINSVEETAAINLFFSIRWRDERLFMRDPNVQDESAWDAYCFKPNVDREKIWTPYVELVNMGPDEELCEEAREIVNIAGQGQFVILHMGFKGCVTADFDMKQFPFDRMKIGIKFRSTSHNLQDVKMISAKDPGMNLMKSCMDPNVKNEEFEIRAVTALTTTHIYPMMAELEGKDRGVWSEFRIEVTLERKPGFVLNKVFVPFTFITLMDFGCFLLTEPEINNRINIGLTLFLTAVALKFSVSGFLPKIPYQTRMDIYVIWIYAIMSALYLQNFFVFFFFGREYFLDLPITRFTASFGKLQEATLTIIAIVFLLVSLWFVFPGFFYGKKFRVLNPFDVTEYMTAEALESPKDFEMILRTSKG